jgi:hypothetical protein
MLTQPQAKRLVWCLAMLPVLGGAGHIEATPVEWEVSQGGNGHFYDFVPTSPRITWREAKQQAKSGSFKGVSGHLLTITSRQELDFVQANLPMVTPVAWLGGFQDRHSSAYREPDSGWKWVTGEAWGFTAWSTPEVRGNDIEPNDYRGGEDFLSSEVSILSGTRIFRWNDYPKSAELDGFYIEYPVAAGEPSTQIRLATDKGTFVIRSSEPGIKVVIAKSGKKVEQIEVERGNKTVKVRAGEYEVELTVSVTGIQAKGGQFTLTHRNRVVLEIFQEGRRRRRP